MLYCVVPHELGQEAFDRLAAYYADNPDVTVILDRREGADRRSGREFGGKRVLRDRRRQRIPGTFPPTDAPE